MISRWGLCAALAAGIGLLTGARQADTSTYWYYDAETALRVARESGRPIVLLKIRADVGEKPKT